MGGGLVVVMVCCLWIVGDVLVLRDGLKALGRLWNWNRRSDI